MSRIREFGNIVTAPPVIIVSLFVSFLVFILILNHQEKPSGDTIVEERLSANERILLQSCMEAIRQLNELEAKE